MSVYISVISFPVGGVLGLLAYFAKVDRSRTLSRFSAVYIKWCGMSHCWSSYT